jgi:hypothetical protein
MTDMEVIERAKDYSVAQKICKGIAVLADYNDCQFNCHGGLVHSGPIDGFGVSVSDCKYLSALGWFIEEQSGMWARYSS